MSKDVTEYSSSGGRDNVKQYILLLILISQLHHLMLPLNSADDSSVVLKLNQAFSIGFYEVTYKIFISSNVII